MRPDSKHPYVYYRDRSVQVTSTAVQVDNEVYRIDELSRIWYQRADRSWRELAGRWGLSLVLIAPVITAALALLIAMQLNVTGGTRLAMVVGAILIGLTVALLLDPILGKLDESFDRGVHVHEIWAERAGETIRLLVTRDALRFGRIYRALQRAVEP